MIQILTALLLGLLTILDPCTLMTSITAIGYIDKEINNKVKHMRSRLNEVMQELDIMYSDYAEYSAMDDSEDLAGIAYKTYDQL